jgi:hypothetical protein
MNVNDITMAMIITNNNDLPIRRVLIPSSNPQQEQQEQDLEVC